MKAQLNWAVSGLLVQTVFMQGGKKNREECEKELRSAAGTQFNKNSKICSLDEVKYVHVYQR